MLLRGGNKSTQRLAQRRIPLAVVHQVGKLDSHLLLVVGRILIQRNGFQHLVGAVQNGAAGCLIYAAALHAHQTVFHQIHQADAVSAADFIKGKHNLLSAHFLAIEGYRHALFKVQRNIFRLVGCLHR